MLTQEEHVEIHALNKRGWTISEIARHTGRDRKTIRTYLAGDREPGVRGVVEPDPFDEIEPYVRQWFALGFLEALECGKMRVITTEITPVTTRRYSKEEKDQAVRFVFELREELMALTLLGRAGGAAGRERTKTTAR